MNGTHICTGFWGTGGALIFLLAVLGLPPDVFGLPRAVGRASDGPRSQSAPRLLGRFGVVQEASGTVSEGAKSLGVVLEAKTLEVVLEASWRPFHVKEIMLRSRQ